MCFGVIYHVYWYIFVRSALLWVITQRIVVIPFWRSGPMGCTETSVRNCHYSLRNDSEERISHLLRGGSLKSSMAKYLLMFWGYCTPLKHQYLTSCLSLTSQKIWIFSTTVRTSNLKHSPLRRGLGWCSRTVPGIESGWCQWIFQWHTPSDHNMALGSTQPLVKMSTRNISWG
jgi:hypothetical protein